MGHRLAPQAQADLDDIAHYVFVESGSLETADRLIELAVAGTNFVLACADFLSVSTSSCIESKVTMC